MGPTKNAIVQLEQKKFKIKLCTLSVFNCWNSKNKRRNSLHNKPFAKDYFEKKNQSSFKWVLLKNQTSNTAFPMKKIKKDSPRFG